MKDRFPVPGSRFKEKTRCCRVDHKAKQFEKEDDDNE
jgi:hypothetical protein